MTGVQTCALPILSPFTIFNSSGNSSRLVARKNFPNLGSLSASGSKFPLSSRLSVILRNLYILKIFPCSPGRSWQKRIGEPSFKRTRRATKSDSGEKRRSAEEERRTSRRRLMYLGYIMFGSFPTFYKLFMSFSTILVGTPTARLLSGISLITTEPAPIIH